MSGGIRSRVKSEPKGMTQTKKNDILEKLKSAPVREAGPRPFLPPLPVLSLNLEERIALFSKNLTDQEGVVHRAKSSEEVRAKLAEIAAYEKLKTIFAATDAILAPLQLPQWGDQTGVRVLTARDYANREAYREAVFNEVQAGITGADYGVAESGTICMIHNQDQPRLVSIAPVLHIALLPVDRLFAVYEQVMDRVYSEKSRLPGQCSFITGPSMTGDIQGGQFKGMHGPEKIIVILIG